MLLHVDTAAAAAATLGPGFILHVAAKVLEGGGLPRQKDATPGSASICSERIVYQLGLTQALGLYQKHKAVSTCVVR